MIRSLTRSRLLEREEVEVVKDVRVWDGAGAWGQSSRSGGLR